MELAWNTLLSSWRWVSAVSKAEVEEYIVSHGGTIDKSVKKTTGILLIGDCECQAYSNGTYGTKVKKAMEYNSKGCNIQIIKEADLIKA